MKPEEKDNVVKKGCEELKHKFFRNAERLCWWCNHNKVEAISITFVSKGGWCVFYKEKRGEE